MAGPVGEAMTGEPEVGRDYYFVRPHAEGGQVARWSHRAGGGALLFEDYPDDPVAHGLAAWPSVLSWLQLKGYVELGEALRAGSITKDEADELVSRLPAPSAPA